MGNKQDTYKPYVGSVRFYKHLILTILVLLIVIPITICIVLFVRQSSLAAAYKKQEQLILKQAAELQKRQSAPEQTGDGTSAESETASGKQEKASQDWNLMVVNEHISLPENFTVNLADIGDGQFVDERIVVPLSQMMEAAKKAGMNIRIYSSYRSMEKQQGLFNASVSQYLAEGYPYNQAFYKTKQNIALPSESEHQTGLMVDIAGLGQEALNEPTEHFSAVDTPEMTWLKDNCAAYGFICRYPDGKTDITGIKYEPYCFRYVGEEAAKAIMSSGITLEEYVDLK